MENPLVSVIIPTYKGTKTLKKAIDSVINQSYKNIEIVIVDDNDPCSLDRSETEKIMHEYNSYANVIYIKNQRNSERSFSRNNGFKHSHGAYIMFLDNDDEFLPRKIESQIRTLQNKPQEYAICYSNYLREKNGKIVCRYAEDCDGNLQLRTLERNIFVHPGSNLMIMREAFEEVGGFDEGISQNEDLELLVRLFDRYKICYCAECGLIVHLGQPSLEESDYRKITVDFRRHTRESYLKYSNADKKKIDNMNGLQVIKLDKNRSMHSIISDMNEYRINTMVFIRYWLYLAVRKITHRAYGFKI